MWCCFSGGPEARQAPLALRSGLPQAHARLPLAAGCVPESSTALDSMHGAPPCMCRPLHDADGAALCGRQHARAGCHGLDEQPQPAERGERADKGGWGQRQAVLRLSGWECGPESEPCWVPDGWLVCTSSGATPGWGTRRLDLPCACAWLPPSRRCSWTGGWGWSCLAACWWTTIGRSTPLTGPTMLVGLVGGSTSRACNRDGCTWMQPQQQTMELRNRHRGAAAAVLHPPPRWQ